MATGREAPRERPAVRADGADGAAAVARRLIRIVPDFPKPGIRFRDIMPLLGAPAALRSAIEHLAGSIEPPDVVAAVESRGFVFGTGLALHWGARLVPVRKFGKLPGRTLRESYALEYGEDALEVQVDAFHRDERVAVVDDLLATGGTAAAAIRLVEHAGARVTAALFLIELVALGGRSRLDTVPVHALIHDMDE